MANPRWYYEYLGETPFEIVFVDHENGVALGYVDESRFFHAEIFTWNNLLMSRHNWIEKAIGRNLKVGSRLVEIAWRIRKPGYGTYKAWEVVNG